MSSSISVIIPCFNESESIAGVIRTTTAALQATGRTYEIIVVDDASTDGTLREAESTGLVDRTIVHRANRGYGASIKAGLLAACHELVVVLDADGQHSPEDLGNLLSQAEECDMVVGARTRQGSHHWRVPGKFLLKQVCQVLVGGKIPDINSGFRVFRRVEAIRLMHLCSDQFSFSTTSTLAFMSDRLLVRFVPITVNPRRSGRSRVSLGTGFSTFMLILRTIGTFNPLRVFMPPTLVLFAVGTTMLVHGLIHSNVGDVAILCLLTSFQLFCFGLLADQIALLRRQISKS